MMVTEILSVSSLFAISLLEKNSSDRKKKLASADLLNVEQLK